MFDEPVFDSRDFPTAEAIEEARALIFPEPLSDVTPHKEREMLGSILAMRNMARRMGVPPPIAWGTVELLLMKIAESVWKRWGDEDRANWLAIVASLRQLFISEPPESEASDAR